MKMKAIDGSTLLTALRRLEATRPKNTAGPLTSAAWESSKQTELGARLMKVRFLFLLTQATKLAASLSSGGGLLFESLEIGRRPREEGACSQSESRIGFIAHSSLSLGAATNSKNQHSLFSRSSLRPQNASTALQPFVWRNQTLEHIGNLAHSTLSQAFPSHPWVPLFFVRKTTACRAIRTFALIIAAWAAAFELREARDALLATNFSFAAGEQVDKETMHALKKGSRMCR